VAPGEIAGAVARQTDGDFTALPFDAGEFDVAASLWTIRRTRRPELLVAELVRVTRPGGTILVVDQLAPVDPLAALELNQEARASDPAVTRVLAEADLRALFDANNLRLRHEEVAHESPGVDVGWFVLTR
jgi:ubiquinone/menaquinone biosynthesis C-methylase UbiE